MHWSDPDFIEKLRQGDEKAQRLLYTINREKAVQWLVSKQGLNEQDALDAYQEAMCLFLEQVANYRLTMLTCSLETYLYAIMKYQYYGNNRSKKRKQEKFNLWKSGEIRNPDNYKDDALVNSHDLPAADLEQYLAKAMNQLPEQYQLLLIDFYRHKIPMAEIAKIYNYKNEDSAKSMKYKAVDQLRSILKSILASLN